MPVKKSSCLAFNQDDASQNKELSWKQFKRLKGTVTQIKCLLELVPFKVSYSSKYEVRQLSLNSSSKYCQIKWISQMNQAINILWCIAWYFYFSFLSFPMYHEASASASCSDALWETVNRNNLVIAHLREFFEDAFENGYQSLRDAQNHR